MQELLLGGQSLVVGQGSLEYLRGVEAKRVFIVTGGSSMITSGVIGKIKAMMEEKGAATYVHSGIPANPDTQVVLAGAAKIREFAPDLLIAVGGGSAIDAAKFIAIFCENPDFSFAAAVAGNLPTRRQTLRFIAIPSTSGTGTEVTKFAVVTFRDKELKVGFRSPAFVPDIAILDAELTMTMPPHVVAETGLDALTHAVECFTNPDLDDFSASLAIGAVTYLFEYLPQSYHSETIESREKVHNAQSMAGLVICNVRLGAAHGIAHAIGGKFNLGHGLANAVALPYVIEYNYRSSYAKSQYQRLAAAIGAKDFATAVRELNKSLDIPASYKATGISEEVFFASLEQITANSLAGPTPFNPAPFTAPEMEALLKRIWAGA